MSPRTGSPTRTGCILAGGQSRRMGGGDKALLEFDGEAMLARVARCLAPQVNALVVNTNSPHENYTQFNLPIIADTLPGHLGPLAGILSGMVWARAHTPNATHLITVSTDAPFLPPDLADTLVTALPASSSPAIAIASSHNRTHPVIGAWPIALADDLQHAIQSGVRKVLAWCDQHPTTFVPFPDAIVNGIARDPFFNINTPADLAHALQRLPRE